MADAGGRVHTICPRINFRLNGTNVVKLSGVSFTTHDLRRAFITTAESLDISAYALKRLLSHKMNNDVTSDYLIYKRIKGLDRENLRDHMTDLELIFTMLGEASR